MTEKTQQDLITLLKLFSEEINFNALNHGFWQDEQNIKEYLQQNSEMYRRIELMSSCEKLALIHSEVSECLEVLRNNKIKADEHCPNFLNIEVELADILIRIIDFAAERRLNIFEAMIAKHEFNLTRPFKHGKQN